MTLVRDKIGLFKVPNWQSEPSAAEPAAEVLDLRPDPPRPRCPGCSSCRPGDCLTQAETYRHMLDIRQVVYQSDWWDLKSELSQFKPGGHVGGDPRGLPCFVVTAWMGSDGCGSWHHVFVGVADLRGLVELSQDAARHSDPGIVDQQYRHEVGIHTGGPRRGRMQR